MIIVFYEYKERGEELKVPHYASAAAARDGNLPYTITTCLYSQQNYLINSILNFRNILEPLPKIILKTKKSF